MVGMRAEPEGGETGTGVSPGLSTARFLAEDLSGMLTQVLPKILNVQLLLYETGSPSSREPSWLPTLGQLELRCSCVLEVAHLPLLDPGLTPIEEMNAVLLWG